jgi:hypothetical protein
LHFGHRAGSASIRAHRGGHPGANIPHAFRALIARIFFGAPVWRSAAATKRGWGLARPPSKPGLALSSTTPSVPAAASRRLVHTRAIRVEAYARTDGLWDLEAELVDTKGGDFQLATGVRKAGDPVHDMRLKVTIDTHLNIVEASADASWVPYPGHCDRIGPDYRKLVGLNLTQDFRRHLRERLGGVHGCTHITELATVLPTAAIQAFAGEVIKTQDASQPAQDEAAAQRKPFQLDRCHALRTDGPTVAQFYPRWYRPSK